MKAIKIVLPLLLAIISLQLMAQIKSVDHFEKVIISPYIKVILVQGDKDEVSIENIKVDMSKLHIEVNNKTLWLYLDGAKQIPKQEKSNEDGYKTKHPLYQPTTVTAVITFKELNDLSIRGEETQLIKTPLEAGEFSLKVYGESKVTFNEVNFAKLHAVFYGESTLDIKAGTIKEQRYTSYGESVINTSAVNGRTGKITAYGEADFTMNVSDRIKVTAFGDAKLHYKGNPQIDKGLHIGDMVIDKID